MKYAFSNEQMRRADAAAIAAGTPSIELMERAGQALARAVSDAMRRKGAAEAIFVCGGGNNGGDGFAAARILRDEGEDVSVLCLAQNFSPDCAAMRARYQGEVLARIPRRRYAVAVDCLFGTGLSRPIEGENGALVAFLASCDYVVACDLPSGLKECGIAPEVCVRADETVSMGQLKCALLMADGADCAGRVQVADIGIPAARPRGRGAPFFPLYHTGRQKHRGRRLKKGGALCAAGKALHGPGASLKRGSPAAFHRFAPGRSPSGAFFPSCGVIRLFSAAVSPGSGTS